VRAGWYLLGEKEAALVAESFASARESKLSCRLLDGDGGEVASGVVRPFAWPRKSRSGPEPTRSLYPGGPAANALSNKSLDLWGARQALEEDGAGDAQRVTVLLPAFLVKGAGGKVELSASCDMPVRFDLTAQQKARAKTLAVAADSAGK
jgi:hypothetical protein